MKSLVLSAGVVLVFGCGGESLGPPDAPSLPDASSGDDASADAAACMTAHEFVLDPRPDNTDYTVCGVVVIGEARNFRPPSTPTSYCNYIAFVEDPAGPAPSGFRLHASTSCPMVDAGSCPCPAIPNSGTPLDAVTNLGDVFTVTGNTGIGTSGVIVNASLVVSSVRRTGTGALVTPVVFSDGTLFARTNYGYDQYNGMLVTIAPPSPEMISAFSQFGNFTFAGAAFLRPDYESGCFDSTLESYPPPMATFHSITGIAHFFCDYGVQPRTMSDFVP